MCFGILHVNRVNSQQEIYWLMEPQSGPPVTRSWGLLVPLHHTSLCSHSPSSHSSKTPLWYYYSFSLVYWSFNLFSIISLYVTLQGVPPIPFNEPWYHLVLCFLLFLSFFFSLDLWWLEGCRGWGVMMYGYSGYSYLFSYGKAVATPSQAVIELLALLSLSFSF